MFAQLYGMYIAAREYVQEHMSEEAVQIHEDRNHNQQDLILDEPPPDTPFIDPHTGMTWERDNLAGEYVYHQGNDCYDAVVTADVHKELNDSPQYQHEVETLQNSLNLTDTDQHSLVPGPQVCFDHDTGERIDSGPGAGTWNYASPLVPGQSDEHMALDMATDLASDKYNAYPPSSEHNTNWDYPADNTADQYDYGNDGGYGNDGSADSD